MPEWCPNCGAYGLAEYSGERHVKRCDKCGYRERIVYTDATSRLKRLIKLHEPDLREIENKERRMDVWKCKDCGFVYGTSVGEKPPDYKSCKIGSARYKQHEWEKVEFEMTVKK